MYKYLNNYIDCVESKHTSYQFRNGYNLSYEEKSSAEHIFSEIFIGDCYPIKKNIKQEKVIIDIGANIGFFTLYALIKNPNSKIIAIEANPKNFKVLEKNILDNKLNYNVQIFNNVVTSNEGPQPFYLSSNSGWSSIYNKRGAKNGEMIHVEPISLSGLFKKSNLEIVDLLKIDIEGAEYDILLNDDFLEDYQVKELFVEVDKIPRDKKYEYYQIINLLGKYYQSIKVINHQSEYPLIHCKDYITK